MDVANFTGERAAEHLWDSAHRATLLALSPIDTAAIAAENDPIPEGGEHNCAHLPTRMHHMFAFSF